MPWLTSAVFRVCVAVAFVGASVATYAVYYADPRPDALIYGWFAALLVLHFGAGVLIGWWALPLPIVIALLLRYVYGTDSDLPGQSWQDYLFVSIVLFPVLVLGATVRWGTVFVVRRRRRRSATTTS